MIKSSGFCGSVRKELMNSSKDRSFDAVRLSSDIHVARRAAAAAAIFLLCTQHPPVEARGSTRHRQGSSDTRSWQVLDHAPAWCCVQTNASRFSFGCRAIVKSRISYRERRSLRA